MAKAGPRSPQAGSRIIPPEALALIAKAAPEAQAAIFYEATRWRPKPGDIAARLQVGELNLIQAIIRELWLLGWRPPKEEQAQ